MAQALTRHAGAGWTSCVHGRAAAAVRGSRGPAHGKCEAQRSMRSRRVARSCSGQTARCSTETSPAGTGLLSLATALRRCLTSMRVWVRAEACRSMRAKCKPHQRCTCCRLDRKPVHSQGMASLWQASQSPSCGQHAGAGSHRRAGAAAKTGADSGSGDRRRRSAAQRPGARRCVPAAHRPRRRPQQADRATGRCEAGAGGSGRAGGCGGRPEPRGWASRSTARSSVRRRHASSRLLERIRKCATSGVNIW